MTAILVISAILGIIEPRFGWVWLLMLLTLRALVQVIAA